MLYLQLLAEGVVYGAALGVVAITFALAYRTIAVFHVAHAGIFTMGGYLAWYAVSLGVPFALALVLSVIGCAMIGVVVQLGVYGPLRQRGATPLVMLIASLGLLIVLQNIAAILFTPNILQFDLPWRSDMLSFAGIHLSVPQVMMIGVGFAVFFGMLYFTNATLLGKRIRAVAANGFLAEITNLQPKRVYVIVLAIASGAVALPGALLATDHGLQPYTGILVLLVAKIAVLAGGMGNVVGTFSVAMMLGIIQNVALGFMSGQWSIALTFSLFILVMLVKPTGLFAVR